MMVFLKFKILLAACVLDLALSEQSQRGLMFLTPTIGLSRERTATERNLEYGSIFQGAQALPYLSRFIEKRGFSIAPGASISANAQPSAIVRIAGGSNRCFSQQDGFDITCALCFQILCKFTNSWIYTLLRSGRLELLFNGTWGTVCDNGFNAHGAHVACRQLGYSSATSKKVS